MSFRDLKKINKYVDNNTCIRYIIIIARMIILTEKN